MNESQELLDALRTNYGLDSQYYKTAKKLVIKETPLEVIYSVHGDDDITVYTNCPNCSRTFDFVNEEHYKYCPECGQKLDWEKVMKHE